MLAIVAATVLAASTPAVPVAHATTASRAAQTARRHNRPPRRGCRTGACRARVAERIHRRRERWAMRRCSNARPRWCVERAILTYRLPSGEAAWMRRVPGCESRWNPTARNARSGAFGLFQYLRSTWLTTRYAVRDWTQAKWQALASAWMVRAGRAREWACR